MQKKTHIVILRFSSLGDIAISVPVLRCFFLQYPNVKVTFVTQEFAKDILYEFSQLEILPFDKKNRHKGLRGLWRLFSEITSLNPTKIVDLHQVIRTQFLAILFFIFNIPVYKINKGRKEKKEIINLEGGNLPELRPTIYRYIDVFEKAGFPLDLSVHKFPKKSSLLKKDTLLFLSKSNKKRIGVAPFASFAGKTYPLELMQQVIETLSKKYEILLFGSGKKEMAYFEGLEKNNSNVSNVSNFLSLKEQLSLISHLDLMLSMDSANAHFAANYNVPVVVIWGMTHPNIGFNPYLQPAENNILLDRIKYPKIPTSVYGNIIPRGYEKAMFSISPEFIIKKINEII